MSRTKSTGMQGAKLQWRVKAESDSVVSTAPDGGATTPQDAPAEAAPQTGTSPVIRISMKNGESEVIAQPTAPTGEQSPAEAASAAKLPRPGGLSLPMEIGTTMLAQAACLTIGVASLFMPAQHGPTNWWPKLHAGSLAYAVPGLLHNWELFAAAAGFCLIPFIRGENRSRLILNVSLSILALMLLAITQQNMIGSAMIILPAIGFLLLAVLNALLAVRVVHPQSAKLARWQMWVAGATAIFWAMPAIDSVGDPGLRAIFYSNAAYGHDLAVAFSAGCFAAFGSAVLALIVPAKGFNRSLSLSARTLSACAAALLLGIGFLISSQISRAFYPTADAQWFGVGLMWAFLLISACGVLLWVGCVQRFAHTATNGQDDAPSSKEIAAMPA